MVNKGKYKTLENFTILKRINQGNTAEIYDIGENKVLKLFRQGIPKEAIIAEYEKVETIQSYLCNIPKAFEVILYKNQYGIIYERIKGIDMIKKMIKKPQKLNFYAKQLAHFHLAIHEHCIGLEITVKQKLNNEIDSINDLSDSTKKKIKDYLTTLPDNNKLCHFDFHPGNVMIQNNKPIIIDWMTACTGDPNSDVARTYLLLQYGELPYANFLVRKLARILEQYICKIYCHEYKKIAGISNNDFEQWILPIAAARLMEWIPNTEKEKLLKIIENKLQLIQIQ